MSGQCGLLKWGGSVLSIMLNILISELQTYGKTL